MADVNGPESIPLAIIGMGCRLPGADHLEDYWRLIIEGRSAVREMPADRMDQSLYYDPQMGVRGKSYSRLAATLTSREFDRQACPIPEELVRSVDKAHLLMCGVAAEALRHAGLDPFDVPQALRRAGVYVGHAQGSELGCDYTYATCVGEAAEFLREVPDFQRLPKDEQDDVIRMLVSDVRGRLPQRTADAADVSACMVAGTISKAFGLDGPFVAINSACASSLQAILLGARALQLGHVNMAIVGGASDCKGDTLVLFSHAQAMSSRDSRPFDADADGLIVGEGYAAVVMKRLDRALADGDRVLAVVRGLGISSDGKGKSLWAPRKEGQMKAMERAYRSGVEMSQLQYLEAHSTATQLGDATELNTLSEVLAPHFPAGHKIPVTSVKANIGHTLETAGLAGVIKAVLCMQHGMIPPAINVTRLNPNIDWDRAPVYVPTKAAPWPSPEHGQPRRAGVNAFGIGGLNMHVVLDEFTESARLLVEATEPARHRMDRHPDDDAIAVIGRGCIFPGAANLNEYWRLLQTGADPKQHVPADRWRSDLAFKPHCCEAFTTPCTLGGFITGYVHDWRRHKIPPKQIQQADPLQFMLLDAMDEAFAEAGYDRKEFDRSRAGVVVGTEFGGDFAFQLQLGLRIPELKRIIERLLQQRGWSAQQAESAGEQYAEVMLTHWPALIDETGSFSTSTLASRLGKTWNLMGGAAAIDAGDASSLAALAIAADMLLAHDCDLMVCAGAQRRMALPEYETLALKRMLPANQPHSPLDAACDGYVPGEGAGVVLLKRLADARRDGDLVHAIIRGPVGAHADDPAQAMQLSMQRSFSQSGTRPSDISVIELDAVGSRDITERQLSAIAQIQRTADRNRPLLLSSVASQIGHTQGAAGMASLLKASLELSHGEVPGTTGVTHAAPAIVENADRLCVTATRTSIADPSSNDSPAAAVISYSRGLAYQVIIESGSSVVRRPSLAEEPSESLTQGIAASAAVTVAAGPTAEVADLESFLVNFVVEQTGYPTEVVELDADLEADLGIDSIKKAQLFGELREYFDITPTAGLTLDDFPTLRHIVRFLAEYAAPTAQSPAGQSPADDREGVHAEPMLEMKSGTAPVNVSSALPGDAPLQRLDVPALSTQLAPPVVHSVSSVIPSLGRETLGDLEPFLINFVVEQTGYPPEVVELDADLEADLGIDSIKKAQLFGELQEYFDITPTGDVTLDDFPTLRHVLDFLAKHSAPNQENDAVPIVETTEGPASHAATAASPVGLSPEPPSDNSAWRIFRCAGSSWDAIQQQFAQALAHPESAYEQCVAEHSFTARDRCRAAVVVDSPSTLGRKLEHARNLLPQPAARKPLENQGIFLREARRSSARIAFVFPGQGSQSHGMLRELVDQCPAAQAAVREIDRALAEYGEGSFAEIAWESGSPLGTDVWTTQLAMLLADYVMLRVLKQRGIVPDVVLGHSYGEFAALVAAGSWDLSEAIRITRARCDAIETSLTTQGGMLATSATPDEIAESTAELQDDVFIANLNAPDQTVVGGKKPALRELERLLKARSRHTRLLPVPCAFHTPLMQSAVGPFEQSLRQARIDAPRVTTYSVANNQQVADADDVRRNLAAHLTHPVRYMELIRQIADEAPTVFVEVGPQQALTRLNARILSDSEPDLIACDQPKRPGIEQLFHVQALLEVCRALEQRETVEAPPAPILEIVHFDATARRRAKMRESASRNTTVTAVAATPATALSRSPERAAAAPVRNLSDTTGGPSSGGRPLPSRALLPPAPAVSPGDAPPAAPIAVSQQAATAVHSRNGTHAAPPKSVAPTGPSTDDLESFLVNFVVEQTGYPPEVVELDADLEADLGIDSIKKAQLFGELQEYFDVTPTEGVTLDDFPTLRHVVRFLASASAPSAPVTIEPPITAVTAAVTNEEPADEREASAPFFREMSDLPRDVPLVQLRGTAQDVGRQHGAELREPIRRALRRIADLSDGRFDELPVSRELLARPELSLSSEVMDELRGIAEGAGVSLGSLLAWNLTLLAELGTGATHLIAAGNRTESGSPLHGLRDDLCLMGSLSECLTPIVQIREEAGKIPFVCVTFAGFVGALAGMNARRLTISGYVPQASPRGEALLPGRHLLFVPQTLAIAADVEGAKRLFHQQANEYWQCCLSQPGSAICIIGRDQNGVRIDQGENLLPTASRSGNEPAGEWTVARLLHSLETPDGARGACCVAILDPGAGNLHVGFGSSALSGTLTLIPAAGFLGPMMLPPAATTDNRESAEAGTPPPAYDLPDEQTRTQRFVMTTVPAALPPDSKSTWQAKGPAVILGNHAAGEALRRRLIAMGISVHSIATSSVNAAVAQLEEIWKRGHAPHLFLMTVRDAKPHDLNDPAEWHRIWEDEVRTPYFVCQRWLQLAYDAKCIDDCSVVAVTSLGGDFGFDSEVCSPQSGALTGLMKALCLEYFVLREHKGFLAKAIDAPAGEDSDVLAALICLELASGTIDYEVAYVGGQRFLQLAVPRPASIGEQSEVRPGGTWVVTGGARGITAESALELGRRFGLKLHVIGSSPLPVVPAKKRDLDADGLARWRSEVMIAARERGAKPNDAWEHIQKSLEMDRSLRRFESAGVRAVYHACNVGDREALSAVLDDIRRMDGPIEGILHGAGIERPCRFEKKTPENVRATFDAKVAGAYHLMTLTRQDPIRHFVAYGSISGRLGSNGQTDYCAASDMLCKLVSWYRTQRRECRAVAFHWHPWDEVGMAARPETRASLARTNGPALMPKAEGLRHLVRELYSPQENCEVLITDREFHQRYYPEPQRQVEPAEREPDVAGVSAPARTGEIDTLVAGRIASRHVLRMEEAPLQGNATGALPGCAVILGDNPAAVALRERLVSEGLRVQSLPADNVDHALRRLEEIWAAEPCRSLFLMTGRESEVFAVADRALQQRQTESFVELPYRVTQRWVQLLNEQDWSEPAIIVAAANLGGAFGFKGAVPSPESGALCGLLKSIHVENVRSDARRFVVKVVDSPADEPAMQLADSIVREITSGTPEVEVAWTGNERRVVRCHRESLANSPSIAPRRGGVWVVTGGARGITAATALDLGQRYGLKLHLIGRSPAPEADASWRNANDAELKLIKRKIVMRAVSEGRSPEEDWDRVRKDREIFESLQSFAQAGVAATYHCCDVADGDALAETLRQIREADGPIEGIIHGAGYAKSARFESQAIDRVRRTLAPKVDGTVALMSLTRQDPLRHFIAFGSLSGRFGGNGLADYAAANDLLAKLCDWFRDARPDCRTCCFHWQTWDRIGMAMIADGVEITKNAFKMEFLSPEEGVAHLHDELCAGLPEGEILITDGYFQRVFYPQEAPEAAVSMGETPVCPRGDRNSAPAVRLPLVDGLERSAADDSAAAAITFDPTSDPFLAQHLLRGKPFLPGVVGIESLLEAVQASDSSRAVRSIRDVLITNGLAFHTDDPIAATVRVTPQDESLVCRLTTELRNRQGRIVDPQRLHVSGVVDLSDQRLPLPLPRPLPPDAPGRPPLGWFPHRYADGGLLTHGPGYRCLTDIAYQYDGGWGRIIAPDPNELIGSRRPQGSILPMAVLDACLVTCGSFLYLQFGGQIEVPHGVERLQWSRQPRPGETCIVRTYFRGRDERHSRFDFALYGEDDEPLLAAVGYRTIRVGGQS